MRSTQEGWSLEEGPSGGGWREKQGQTPKAVGHTEKFGLYLPDDRQDERWEGLKQVCNQGSHSSGMQRTARKAGLGRQEEHLRDLVASVLARRPHGLVLRMWELW